MRQTTVYRCRKCGREERAVASPLAVDFVCRDCREPDARRMTVPHGDDRETEERAAPLPPPRNAREAARRRAAGQKKAFAMLAGGCAVYLTLMASMFAMVMAFGFVVKRGATPLVVLAAALACGWVLVTVMMRVVSGVTKAERRVDADVAFRDHLERGQEVLRAGGPAGQLALAAPDGRSGALSEGHPRGAVAIARIGRRRVT